MHFLQSINVNLCYTNFIYKLYDNTDKTTVLNAYNFISNIKKINIK